MKMRLIDIMHFLTTGDVNITEKYGIPQAKLKDIKHILKEGKWAIVGRIGGRRKNAE